MPAAIDFHAHWLAPELIQALRLRRSVPTIERGAEDEMLVTWLGRRPLRPLCDLAERRASMARDGVGVQVLSLPGLFGIDSLPLTESLPLVRSFNDAAAALARAEPQRFAALAALPLADIGAACRELERTLAAGMSGAILPADGFVSSRLAQRYRPLFEIGARAGSHFFVHPGPIQETPAQSVACPDRERDWQRWIVLETQARLSHAFVTLELSDYLDAYEGATVQVANLGGSIAFLVERIDEVRRNAEPPLPPVKLGRCYVDTASFGSRSISMAAACFGAQRLLFGSDCPIFAAGRARDAIAQACLDGPSRALILAGNAHRILRRG